MYWIGVLEYWTRRQTDYNAICVGTSRTRKEDDRSIDGYHE